MVYSRKIVQAKHNFGASLNIRSKAKELRMNMTKHEKILWKSLRLRQPHGMHFRRQHPFGIYILDFYCFEANLVIEVDGLVHESQEDYDLERTKDLESSGLFVMRFTNSDIEDRLDLVLDKINSFLSEKSQ
jgi:very-short-patch-repair endonuclease